MRASTEGNACPDCREFHPNGRRCIIPMQRDSEEVKALRSLIRSHGKTIDTPSGPQYVGCQCAQCVAGREKLKQIK